MSDKQPKCFVPACNNTVGVLFPKKSDIKEKWLTALGLEHLRPDPKSFVCLDHFEDDGQPGIKMKMVSSGSQVSQRKKSSLSALQQKINTVQKLQVLKQETPNSRPQKTFRKRASVNPTNSLANADDIQENIESNHEDTTVYSSYEKICRLCMVQSSNVTESVLNKLDDDHTIAHAIGICLYPLKVLPGDNLSENICKNCAKSLKGYLKFHQTCLAMDVKQREPKLDLNDLNDHDQQSDENNVESDYSEEYLHEERLSDYEENKENKEYFRQDNTNGQLIKHPSDADNNEKSTLDRVTNAPTTSAKRKYDKGEEELLKVLEGNDDVVLTKVNKASSKEFKSSEHPASIEHSISDDNHDESYQQAINDGNESAILESPKKDEGEYTEDIIIEMVNDEAPETTTPDPPLLDMAKLPITIRRVVSTSPKRKSVKRKLDNSTSFSTKRNGTMLPSENSEEIVFLPSGISVEVKETYRSRIGRFKSEPLKYVFNSEYLLADGYLYEYRLIKNNVRRLQCVINKCPGEANQFRRQNQFLENIEVISPHNHVAPDKFGRKKQMFYHILYGKMRRDKNFNFKILYEQLCKLDPSLTDILPLRSVITEICKKGPAPTPPPLKSFDEFYELIEDDVFHKFHFTDNRVQFYQDRFETDDGAKAVVFGNQQVIDGYSQSKLMYVDASFVIDSDQFPYQLVTVLVWVDESYYPVLYAFVNVKSQDIYKKIFGFLYSDLAPNLRPHEIITDYEANLYYALGETYVESSIGGSMFYFTQNIYKKICSLNLARELELNSNFRSIYNMLLMLPLLPVNTILDGLDNIEVQAKELELEDLTNELFIHIHNEWICKVTPELFCVHRLENRINENIVAPFKKLRDLIMLSKNKSSRANTSSTIVNTIEKLIDLEKFLRDTYTTLSRKAFTKDLSSFQKKIILKVWNYIENHPMININQFFHKVLGYIKCMETQLWIWGFYRHAGESQDSLIDSNNFSIVNDEAQESEFQEQLTDAPMEEGEEEDQSEVIEEYYIEEGGAIRKIESRESANFIDQSQSTDQQENEHEEEEAVVMEAVIDENGSFVLQDAAREPAPTSQTRKLVNHVYK